MGWVLCRYLHCRDGEGEEAQELCNILDLLVVDMCASLDETFRHLLPRHLVAGAREVLMADGKVPFTMAAITRNYWSPPHTENNDLNALGIRMWMYGGESWQEGVCMRCDRFGCGGCGWV